MPSPYGRERRTMGPGDLARYSASGEQRRRRPRPGLPRSDRPAASGGLGCPWSGQPDRRTHRLQRWLVMPFALAQRVLIAAAPRHHGAWSVTSLNNDSTETFETADLQPGMAGWQAYVAGVVWALQEAGHRVGGADLVLTSDVA